MESDLARARNCANLKMHIEALRYYVSYLKEIAPDERRAYRNEFLNALAMVDFREGFAQWIGDWMKHLLLTAEEIFPDEAVILTTLSTFFVYYGLY